MADRKEVIPPRLPAPFFEVAYGAQGDVGPFGQLFLGPIQPSTGGATLFWCKHEISMQIILSRVND